MKGSSAAVVVLSSLAGSGLAAPSKQAEAMHYNHMNARDMAVQDIKTLQKLATVPTVQKFFQEVPLLEKVVNVALSGEPVTKEAIAATDAEVEALDKAITATPGIGAAIDKIPLLKQILGQIPGFGGILDKITGATKGVTDKVDGATGDATKPVSDAVNGATGAVGGALGGSGGSGGSKSKREEAAAQLDLQALLGSLSSGDLTKIIGALTGAVGDVGKTAGGAVGGATDAVGKATGAVTDAAGGAKSKREEAAAQLDLQALLAALKSGDLTKALGAVTGAVGDVGKTAGGAVGGATDAVGKATGAVGDVASGAVDGVKGAAGAATDAAKGAVGDVAKTASDATGGALTQRDAMTFTVSAEEVQAFEKMASGLPDFNALLAITGKVPVVGALVAQLAKTLGL